MTQPTPIPTQITALPKEDYEEVFNFKSPETVIFEVVPTGKPNHWNTTWNGFEIDTINVIGGAEGITGAASYEMSYGGFLDDRIMEIVDFPGEGWFVVEVEGHYTRGDGWTTDDDMEFYAGPVTKATQEQIDLA